MVSLIFTKIKPPASTIPVTQSSLIERKSKGSILMSILEHMSFRGLVTHLIL